MRTAAALIIMLAACKDGGVHRKEEPESARGSAAPAGSAAPPAQKLDKLTVTIDGKPFAVTTATIKRMPAGRSQIFLGNYAASCQELRDNVFNGGKDREDVLVNTATRLAPDGTKTTIVSDLSFHGPGDVTDGSKATVGSFDGKTVDVALDFKGVGMNKQPVEIHGTFTAENCGDQDKDGSGAPKAAHPANASITVAGAKFPLAGALRKDGGDILLSVSPRDCSGWIPWAEVRLDRVRDTWNLGGNWLDKEYSNHTAPDDNMAKVKVVTGAKGTSADGPTVKLTLSGAGIVEKYPVAIEGEIEAIDCPKDQ